MSTRPAWLLRIGGFASAPGRGEGKV